MGGCTTYVVKTIIQRIIDDYDIIGYPRLVRLNPNVPWKTRGNGALSLRIGKKGEDAYLKIGEINGTDVFSSHSMTQELDDNERKEVYRIIQEILAQQAHTEDDNTNPGFVLMQTPPEPTMYHDAVTRIVPLDEVLSFLKDRRALFEGYKNKRGLIGATAAIAWVPQDRTYEVIAYRKKERWGTKRDVDPASVQTMDAAVPSTFDNYDYQNKHNRITPNSPCPILFGIRGDHPGDLMTAASMIRGEPLDSWLVFESNQGTDDHLQRKLIRQVQPYESVIIEGHVEKNPWTIQGGHVLFSLRDDTGTIPCAAYEPTKEFRGLIRWLYHGDTVEVSGGVREQPLTVNLEKITVKHLSIVQKKRENPVCPVCGKHMKSKGTGQGYKCMVCKTTSNTPRYVDESRALFKGSYEVPVCARRHLSKPLKRTTTSKQRISIIGNAGTPR
jgi:tRNA(Ile2)-agmatinylcytidine synthase